MTVPRNSDERFTNNKIDKNNKEILVGENSTLLTFNMSLISI